MRCKFCIVFHLCDSIVVTYVIATGAYFLYWQIHINRSKVYNYLVVIRFCIRDMNSLCIDIQNLNKRYHFIFHSTKRMICIQHGLKLRFSYNNQTSLLGMIQSYNTDSSSVFSVALLEYTTWQLHANCSISTHKEISEMGAKFLEPFH